MVKQLRKRFLIKKSLKLSSPLLFTAESVFYYEFRKYSYFLKFVNNENTYKPTKEEIKFLSNYINEHKNSSLQDTNNNNIIQILPKFYEAVINLKKLPIYYNSTTNKIKTILNNYNKYTSISISKIKKIYEEQFTHKISRIKIYRILKNKFQLSFRKTALKPKILDNILYKKMSFLFIKSMIRALSLNFNFVFLDESNFKLNNTNYRMWRSQNDFFHYGNIKRGKKNFLLAIGVNEVIHYKLTSKNTNSLLFKKFFLDTIKKISKKERNTTIFVMDNLTSHLTNDIKKIIKSKSLKVFCTVPYESVFNPIELSFRAIKNITYKNIYNNIKDLKKDIQQIIKSDKFQNTINKNFIETLSKYLLFIEENKDKDLNSLA